MLIWNCQLIKKKFESFENICWVVKYCCNENSHATPDNLKLNSLLFCFALLCFGLILNEAEQVFHIFVGNASWDVNEH